MKRGSDFWLETMIGGRTVPLDQAPARQLEATLGDHSLKFRVDELRWNPERRSIMGPVQRL